MPNANNHGIGDRQVHFIVSVTALPSKASIFGQVKKKKALPV
jgi:hypothetical protein